MSSSSLHCSYFIVMSWEISKELLSQILHISLHTKLSNIIVSFKIICVDKSSIHTPHIADTVSQRSQILFHQLRKVPLISKPVSSALKMQIILVLESRLIFISSIQVGALYHDVFFAGAARAYVSTLTRLRNTMDSWSQNSGIA